MKIFGVLLFTLGCGLTVYALATGIAAPHSETVNLGLIADRELAGTVGSALMICGAILFAGGCILDVLDDLTPRATTTPPSTAVDFRREAANTSRARRGLPPLGESVEPRDGTPKA